MSLLAVIRGTLFCASLPSGSVIVVSVIDSGSWRVHSLLVEQLIRVAMQTILPD